MTILPANDTTEPEEEFWNVDYPRSDDEAMMLWGLATEPTTTLGLATEEIPF